MGNLNGWQGNFLLVDAIIPQGATESAPISTGGMSVVGIMIPSIFTGTSISYEVGDNIAGFQAVGQVSLDSNPANNDTLTINGTVVTFVTGTPSGNQVKISAVDAAHTLANLLAFLQASTDTGLVACTYSSDLVSLLTITAVAHGTAGNAYTFTKSSTHITLTPSGGVLSGGGFRPLYNSSNSLISYTVAAGRSYSLPAADTECVAFLVVKSGSTEVNGRTLVLSLKGV